MPTSFVCPNGHRWDVSESDPGTFLSLGCPICGAHASPSLEGANANAPTLEEPWSWNNPAVETALPPTGTPARADASPTEAVPGYVVLGELGRGGMGVVYQARQVGLNRLCALKMVLAGSHASEDELARFKTEAEAIARLQHPNIVAVYEVGRHEGRPFFSMEFCAGGSLERKLADATLPPAQAARLLETLARAMHAAHKAHVIHRDLKPANVLLTEDGTPKITDFGLAKKLDEVGQTQTGSVMGSPSWMAPEQAQGRKDIGPLADVYALGAILYEMLAGRPPFKAATMFETLVQVIEREPTPPRLLNPAIDRDLESICLRCLEKDPAKRYPSADELAQDLGRHLRGEPVTVRRSNVLDRLIRTLGRDRLGAEFHAYGNVLLLFAFIALASGVALHLIIRAGLSASWLVLPQAGQLLLMVVALWFCGPSRKAPSGPFERQFWAIWGGYLLTRTLLGWVNNVVLGAERLSEFALFPYWSLLAGFAFLVMGPSYWGRLYAVAGAFYALTFVMLAWPECSPLAFGLLWSVVLLWIGLRLRRLGREGRASE